MPTSRTASKATASSKGRKSAAVHAKSSAKGDTSPDAFTLLMEDHKAVKKLFKAYEKLVKDEAGSEEKQMLANQICEMLTVHATIEEEIFYPAAREALPEQDVMDEAEVEHASAEELIAQIQSMSPDEELYDAKVRVLGEYIEHHVKEEESQMFPKVKKAMKDDESLDQIGEELATRKQELEGEPPAGMH